MRDVVELVVRFGETIIDVAHVGPDATYRIGTARTVDLAVPGYTSYPLVDAGRLRCPHGVVTHVRAGTTRIELGQITIDATQVERGRVPVPYRRPEWRTPLFVAASLIVHIALWLVAITLEPFERLIEPQRPRLRFAHVTYEPPPEPQPPQPPSPPQPVKAAAAAAPPKPEDGARIHRASGKPTAEAVTTSFSESAQSVADTIAKIDVKRRVGELKPEDTYNEDDANSRGFGGSPRFPPGEIIQSGAYETMSLDVTLCPNKSCTVRGPIPALYIRTHLHSVMSAIFACYTEHASGPGTIVLEMRIDVDGTVVDAKGSGLGETGACAARVASTLYFKALGRDAKPGQPTETRVRYPLRFNGEREL